MSERKKRALLASKATVEGSRKDVSRSVWIWGTGVELGKMKEITPPPERQGGRWWIGACPMERLHGGT